MSTTESKEVVAIVVDDDPTSLYLYYDANDILLYVGITGRGMQRQVEHNGSKDWWPYVARQDIKHYATRDAALEEERRTILSLRPPFNRQHNPDYEVKSAAYLAYSPAPKTEQSGLESVRICDICGIDIAGKFSYSVDQQDLQYAIESSKDFQDHLDADEMVRIFWSLDEVLALTRASRNKRAAAAGIAELLGVTPDSAHEFLSKPVSTLTEEYRQIVAKHSEDLEDVPNPSLAQWRIHHQTCSDSVYSFEAAGPLKATDVVVVTNNLHRFCSDWVMKTDWMRFFPRLLAGAE